MGLKKEEYKLIAAGGTEGRLATMEKNLAQGTLVPPPVNVKMENQGYRLMGNGGRHCVSHYWTRDARK